MTKQARGLRHTLLSAQTIDNGAPVNGTAATETLTLTGLPLNNEIVTIKDTVYTWKDALSPTNDAYEALIGASASDSLDNLIAAINDDDSVEATGGYGRGTAAHPEVFAAAGAGDTMDIEAKVVGTAANAYATTETLTNGSWGAATMSGGVDRSGFSICNAHSAEYLTDKWSLEIVITGSGAIECDAYLWGYEEAGTYGNDGEYAKLGAGTNRGHVNVGQKISGTDKEVWRDVIMNLGQICDAYLEIRNRAGTSFSADAVLTMIEEVH